MMALSKIKFLICILVFNLLVCSSLNAQYSPFFQNYDLSQYNAGNQNWGISKAENGKIYVANNKGLLEFDGLVWELYTVPNKTTIRSVLAVDDKIYVGSYEEFGYWKPDHSGVLKYTSLSKILNQTEFLNEEFWQITAFDGAIIFRSFLNIYAYEDGVIHKIKPPSTIISCDVVQNRLYVSTLRNGIFTLVNTTLIPAITNPVLTDTKVISIKDFDNKLFITTALKGCFFYSKNQLVPWNTAINELIKQNQLNSFSILDNGNMVFGTIQDGVYVTDHLGAIKYHVNKENGLINNTVLSQYIDNDKQLWLGLDNGLASIDLKSKYTFYNDVTGKLGAVYDVLHYKNTMYIASNTGLYYLDQDYTLQFIEGSQGQVWELSEIDGQLFCGHNNGTYIVENKTLKLVSPYTGGWTLKKVPEQPDMYIQGTYAGLVRYKRDNNQWQVKHLGKTTMPVRFLVFEEPHIAWAAHAYKGLFRIRFNDTYDTINEVENYKDKGLWSNYNVRVYNIKNEICVITNRGWQKYEPLLDSIVPFELLNSNFGKESYIISEDDTDIIAIKNKGNVINFRSFVNKEHNAMLINKYFKERMIVGYENISKLNDSVFALNLIDGFMLINKNQKIEDLPLFRPTIEEVTINNERVAYTENQILEIPKSKDKLLVSVSSPKSQDHFFEYSIPDIDAEHWYKLENEKLELSNINHGDYQLLFRTANSLGQVSPVSTLHLNVLPPWYRSKTGFLLYALGLLLTLGILYLLHKRKLAKEERLLQVKFEKEQRELLKEQTLENDKRIVELKNESLKNEVKLKSKQLANTAMALVKKNETLQELKKELVQHKKAFDGYFTYKNLVKKIDSSIGHDDEWEVFEYNFNQVHDEFFNELKRKHQKITTKDLKICAYIKMGLTTKEISPLLNISIRGVETQRYRLKQKLELDSDNSVTEYLRNFK